MKSIYKLCPAALYSVVQSHCSILSHDTLHHCLSSNSSLENGKRELGHLFCYCRSCKNTLTVLLKECAFPATGNSRVHYLKSDYIIQLIAFRLDTAYIHSSPDPSYILQKCVWLARLQLHVVDYVHREALFNFELGHTTQAWIVDRKLLASLIPRLSVGGLPRAWVRG